MREELNKCYRGEGVNHLKNCKELADLYTRMIRDNKVRFFSRACVCIDRAALRNDRDGPSVDG